HRGRAKVFALQKAEREKIVQAGRKGPQHFWNSYKNLTDPRVPEPDVTLDEMSNDFTKRLNYPSEMPEAFDGGVLMFNAEMAALLANEPIDTTPLLSLTRKISLEEIEEVKAHLKEHGL
ncbi:hypothetical protein C8F01DRAFT_969286, partial [Mycena amicta]